MIKQYINYLLQLGYGCVLFLNCGEGVGQFDGLLNFVRGGDGLLKLFVVGGGYCGCMGGLYGIELIVMGMFKFEFNAFFIRIFS